MYMYMLHSVPKAYPSASIAATQDGEMTNESNLRTYRDEPDRRPGRSGRLRPRPKRRPSRQCSSDNCATPQTNSLQRPQRCLRKSNHSPQRPVNSPAYARFAQQIKHVGVFNFRSFKAILGEAQPNEGDNGPGSARTKAEILTYVRASFEIRYRAINTFEAATLLRHVPGLTRGIRRVRHAARPGRFRDLACVRSLRPDGGIPSHEQHRAAGQSRYPTRQSAAHGRCEKRLAGLAGAT